MVNIWNSLSAQSSPNTLNATVPPKDSGSKLNTQSQVWSLTQSNCDVLKGAAAVCPRPSSKSLVSAPSPMRPCAVEPMKTPPKMVSVGE